MDRINVINKSIAAFLCGLIGLMPLIGLPFGVAALALFLVARQKSTDWNPAERYLDWGVRFALIGFGLTLFAFAILFLTAISSQTSHSSWVSGYRGED